jgi:LacI family transcriptional regulator
MKDIARDLGVSLMTVSKALRSHRDISEETRRRVLQRARELNYRPNRVAQSLVNGRTHLIGLVIPDLMHSFFAEVARGISQKLDPLGYQVVIANSEEIPATENRQLELLMDRRVDGFIIASSQQEGASLAQLDTPFVLIDRRITNSAAHFVGADDEEIGAIATQHLIDEGCQRIAHIRGPDVGTAHGRYNGYLRTLHRNEIQPNPDWIVSGQHSDESGYDSMRRLLERPSIPDGVFCYNDPVATGAMLAIHDAGLRVPKDIAVAGAGNVHYSRLLRVPLTTVDQNSLLIGERAAELLLESLEAGSELPAQTVLLPPRLIVRQSSTRSAV